MLRTAARQTSATGSVINSIARTGFDAGGSSGLYDRARPAYEAIGRILSSCSSGGPLRLVELGAGTGICTRNILSALPAGGLASYRAIEPSEGMRSHFTKSILAPDGLLPALQHNGRISSTAEDLNAGEDNDAVVIAQAFHWCQDFDGAARQAARALRKGGILALIWNLEDRDAAPWVARIRDLYEAHEGDAPQYRHGAWKAVYDSQAFKEFFTPEEPVYVTRALPTTLQGVKDRMLSKSYISNLPQQEQDSLVRKVENLFEGNTDEQLGRRWIDKDQGVWKYPYRTDLFLYRRKQILTADNTCFES